MIITTKTKSGVTIHISDGDYGRFVNIPKDSLEQLLNDLTEINLQFNKEKYKK